MLYLDKKGAVSMLVGTVVTLIMVLIFLVIFFAVIGAFKSEFVSETSLTSKLCQMHNSVRSGEGFLSDFNIPFFNCKYLPIQESIDIKGLDILLHDTWWMFLEGEKDMDNFGDEIYTVYSFKLEEDVTIDELLNYMLTHRRGVEVTSFEDSDFNYLEQNTPLQTICFDMSDKEGIANKKLIAKETYYIMYYDDVELIELKIAGEKSDAILISKDQEFDMDDLEKSFYALWGSANAMGALTLNPISLGIVYFTYGQAEDIQESCLGYAVEENI
jgi:hypothetical protein